jgi:hypothetical protein
VGLYPTRAGARIEEVTVLFLRTHEVRALHARAIEEFGGLHGVRDAGTLEAALTAAEKRTGTPSYLRSDVCLPSDPGPCIPGWQQTPCRSSGRNLS